MPVHATQDGVNPRPDHYNDSETNKLRSQEAFSETLVTGPQAANELIQKISPRCLDEALARPQDTGGQKQGCDSPVDTNFPAETEEDWEQIDIYTSAPLRRCSVCHKDGEWSELTLGPPGWICVECCEFLVACGELYLGHRHFENTDEVLS